MGDQQDYGMRIYDPRVGRFLSVDPLAQKYPWYTPYQFAGNTPIQAIDLDGLEPWQINDPQAPVGVTETVYGPYSNQEQAQSAADAGEQVPYLNPITIKGESRRKAITQAPTQSTGDARLSVQDFESIGQRLNLDPATVFAVTSVESGGGNGFTKDGKVLIRFEGHQFKKFLKKEGIDADKLADNGYGNVIYDYSYSKEHPELPHGYTAYNKAYSLNSKAAELSTSFGAFQIMGFNSSAAGYNNVDDFVNGQQTLSGQMNSFMNMVGGNPYYLKPLQQNDFATFAKHYNGSDYKSNKYDTKMQRAYSWYKEHSQSMQTSNVTNTGLR